MSEESKASKKGFLDLLKKEFTVNDFMDKYGQGGYANTPNIPYEIPQSSPDTHHAPWYQPYQPYQPYQQQPWTNPDYNPFRRQLENQLEEALRVFEEEQRRERERNRLAQRQIEDHIARMFGNDKVVQKNAKKDAFKAAFIQLISDRIEFDDNGNIIDDTGVPIKSIGAFGLLFIRILNSVLESKKSAEENEKDLKDILKSE